MKDSYGREIDYMRISITDRCNLRCRYCMPEGTELVSAPNLLTFEEISEVCMQAAVLGVRKIKITGGEPLVRRGAPALIGMLYKIPGIKDVTLTTNGVLLEEFLPELIKNGLKSVNVSLDAMNRELYQSITGKDSFFKVMRGIAAAEESGIRIKMNTVLLREYNENEWEPLVEYARTHPADVRFIEVMPIGLGRDFSGVSYEEVFEKIRKKYPGIKKDERIHGNGPAKYYTIPGFTGSVGFISAMHDKFCENCSRIRMSAQGELKSCLCYGASGDLRNILRNIPEDEKRRKAVKELLRKVIDEKPPAHCFDKIDKITEDKKMIAIGG